MGFAANRNVFALQLLLLAALQIIHLDKLTLWFNNGRFYVASVLLLGVYLTFSRSGIIIGIILVLLLLVLKLISRKNIVQIMVQCCLLFAFLYIGANLFWFGSAKSRSVMGRWAGFLCGGQLGG